jgi:hypothetical protein
VELGVTFAFDTLRRVVLQEVFIDAATGFFTPVAQNLKVYVLTLALFDTMPAIFAVFTLNLRAEGSAPVIFQE